MVASIYGQLRPCTTGVLTAWELLQWAYGHWDAIDEGVFLTNIMCCIKARWGFSDVPVMGILRGLADRSRTIWSRRSCPGRTTVARSRRHNPSVHTETDRDPAGGCPAYAGPAETSRSQPCSIQCRLRQCAHARTAPVPVEAPGGHPRGRPADPTHIRDLRNLKQVPPPARKTGCYVILSDGRTIGGRHFVCVPNLHRAAVLRSRKADFTGKENQTA
ncbi:hypothetical protein NDU88_008186 [Pleurodeles waltl]|uniref:Uncharacterized protein n=1 Tax=Pleurodeles waltl TaxID=8319 RepID=A0AAV7PQX7_PLEWA|nr:hypothetical protein NDU88_008186 [Pleurodeles waltl]